MLFANRISSSTSCSIWLPETSPPSSARDLLGHRFQSCNTSRLTVPARHKYLADLVGASRPRVTEFLIQFERDNLIIRDQRRLIVRRDSLENFLAQAHSGTSSH